MTWAFLSEIFCRKLAAGTLSTEGILAAHIVLRLSYAGTWANTAVVPLEIHKKVQTGPPIWQKCTTGSLWGPEAQMWAPKPWGPAKVVRLYSPTTTDNKDMIWLLGIHIPHQVRCSSHVFSASTLRACWELISGLIHNVMNNNAVTWPHLSETFD